MDFVLFTIGMTKQSYIEAVLAAIEDAKITNPGITVR